MDPNLESFYIHHILYMYVHICRHIYIYIYTLTRDHTTKTPQEPKPFDMLDVGPLCVEAPAFSQRRPEVAVRSKSWDGTPRQVRFGGFQKLGGPFW